MKVLVIDQSNKVVEEWEDIMSVEVLGRKIRLISYCPQPSHFDLHISGYRYQILPEYKEK